MLAPAKQNGGGVLPAEYFGGNSGRYFEEGSPELLHCETAYGRVIPRSHGVVMDTLIIIGWVQILLLSPMPLLYKQVVQELLEEEQTKEVVKEVEDMVKVVVVVPRRGQRKKVKNRVVDMEVKIQRKKVKRVKKADAHKGINF